ncbi:uncharacterized protein LOC116942986 isoform X4 [Petromyzon marinus]
MPGVLQAQFQGNLSCSEEQNAKNATVLNGGGGCETPSGLGLTPSQYNLLYAVYAWGNVVLVIPFGYLMDKIGNRVSVMLFSSFCMLGSLLFALSIRLRGSTRSMLALMLAGRVLFGCGNVSLIIVQFRIVTFWFREKELAMAFGVTIAFSRLGSVLNFLCTESFEHRFGLEATLGSAVRREPCSCLHRGPDGPEGPAAAWSLRRTASRSQEREHHRHPPLQAHLLDARPRHRLLLQHRLPIHRQRQQVHPGHVRGLLPGAGVPGGWRDIHGLDGAVRRVWRARGPRGSAWGHDQRGSDLHASRLPRVGVWPPAPARLHALARSRLLREHGLHVAGHIHGGAVLHPRHGQRSRHVAADARGRGLQPRGRGPARRGDRGDRSVAVAERDALLPRAHSWLPRLLPGAQRRGPGHGPDHQQITRAPSGGQNLRGSPFADGRMRRRAGWKCVREASYIHTHTKHPSTHLQKM